MSAFPRTPKWFLPSLVLVAVVLQGYGIFRFKTQRDGLLDQKQGLEKRQALLEKKYAEEKARAGDLLRLKASWEAQTRALQSDLEKLRQEHDALLARTGGGSGFGLDPQKSVQSLEAQVASLTQNLERSEQAKKDLERKAAETAKGLQSRIVQLEDENRTLQADLQREREFRELCRTDNAKLASLADELMQKFREKGVVDSLLQKEPFTQIKRVELEEMLQKYKESKADHMLTPAESEGR